VLKRKLLESIDGVLAVHEFHVWQLTGDRIIASAHIRCFNMDEYMKARIPFKWIDRDLDLALVSGGGEHQGILSQRGHPFDDDTAR